MEMENRTLALRDIRQIAHKMRASGLSSIELTDGHYRLRLKTSPRPVLPPSAAVPAPAATPQKTESLCAPMPGVVLLQHPLADRPYITPGAAAEKDALLGLLKVGPVYLPLRSPVKGVVASVAIAQGECVEYGEPIFTLLPAEEAA
jgi:biotin carboxyl carrier protein